jgi:putative ABC transport system permease protein
MRTDIRNAARGLLRTPTVTGSAILCLTLGLGATTAIASAIDRALVRPLPFRAPDRLLTIYRTAPQANDWPTAPAKYLDAARATRQLSALAAIQNFGVALLDVGDRAEQVHTVHVTGNLFPLLGVVGARGRLITVADDSAGGDPIVVLSDELWKRDFGADPRIIGRPVRLDGTPTTVIGVLPRGFFVPEGQNPIRGDVWLPIRFSPQEAASRGTNYLEMAARLAPGATFESANHELHAIVTRMIEEHPGMSGEDMRAVPMQAEGVRTVRTPLLMLFGAVVGVLLIAATNVASLLLARGLGRRREMAVRTALGGSRWAVMRPVLLESLLLTGVGAALGLGLAWIGVRTIGSLAADQIEPLRGLSIDLRIVAFAIGLSLLVALLCGALPAWRTASIHPQEALAGSRGASGGRREQRALSTLVIVEVGLSLVLLVGAALVLRGFVGLTRRDPGFDPRPVLTMHVAIPGQKYDKDTSAIRRFLVPALAAIEHLPGVGAASAIQTMPYENWGNNFNVRYEGVTSTEPEKLPLVDYRVVSPSFFQVTRQHLIAGRLLRDDDDARAGVPSVVVVNEALAKRDFPGQNPVGKRFACNVCVSDSAMTTIVGEVSDIRNAGPFEAPVPEAYYTYAQTAYGNTYFPFMVRVKSMDPTAVAPAVRAAIRGIDPEAAVSDIRAMPDVIALSMGTPRFYLTLLGIFAAVALALAVAGVYGVLSYAVEQRMRELGIRRALGSTGTGLLNLVTRRGLMMIGSGLVLGMLGGFALTRVLRDILYGVSPIDGLSWLSAILALASAGILASLVPALRAARADPLIAIRVE